MNFEVRPIKRSEIAAYARAGAIGFGGHATEESVTEAESEMDLDRTVAAFHDGRIVGTALSYPHRIAVPGAAKFMAAVSNVSVMPTHRRRGALAGMMDYQLADAKEQGWPLAGLYASESPIYGRFGYGVATTHERWKIDRSRAVIDRISDADGHTSFITAEEAKSVLPSVYDRVWEHRVGMLDRDERRWKRRFRDRGEGTHGTAFFFVTYRADERVDGYVVYRIRHKDNTLVVHELISATDEAYVALWRYCLGVDLIRSIADEGPYDEPGRPTDEALPWMLADFRGLKRTPTDALYLRLVDVPAALGDRTYSADGSLVVQVIDEFCGWNDGRWAIEGGPEGAECRKSSATADLTLSAADLAAAYLGGVDFRTLARAGRVDGALDAVVTADAMFTTERAPWCGDFW